MMKILPMTRRRKTEEIMPINLAIGAGINNRPLTALITASIDAVINLLLAVNPLTT
jgi:hypothetical protein